MEPNARAAADIDARTSTGVALPANVASPTTAATTRMPRSTPCRTRRAVGAARSIRMALSETSLTQARSRPDHVAVRRRRLDRTRAPATTGFPLALDHFGLRVEPRDHPRLARRDGGVDRDDLARVDQHLLARAHVVGRDRHRLVAVDDPGRHVELLLDALARGLQAHARTRHQRFDHDRHRAREPGEGRDG